MKKMYIIVFLTGLILASASFLDVFAQEINKDLYAKRRQKLMEKVKDGIVIIQNSDEAKRSKDGFYAPYRVNSNFYYLTGFEDANAAFILLPREEKKFIMFVQPKNAMSSLWFGDVTGVEGAMKNYGADTAYAFQDFYKVIGKYLTGKKKIYIDYGNEALKYFINGEIEKIKDGAPKEHLNIADIIHEMRFIKDAEEIKLIRKAVDITCNAHLEAMKAIKPGMYEYEIAAIYSYIFEKEGAGDKAFASIVASGPNSTIYHYSKNNRKTKSGDLIMLDMGSEYYKYASDVTRVLPVNGKYTTEQKNLYEITLEMEKAVINYMKPGNKFGDCLKIAENIAKDRLFKLGLITNKNSDWQYLLYYYPGIIHNVGLDVHDVGKVRINTEFKPGMVFALEPLVYVGENLIESFKLQAKNRFSVTDEVIDSFLKTIKPVFEKYKQVAARVEDDILITENGNEVLSSKLPKTVKDIEKIMTEKSYLNK